MKHFFILFKLSNNCLGFICVEKAFFFGGGGVGATQSPTHNQLPKRSEKDGKKKK